MGRRRQRRELLETLAGEKAVLGIAVGGRLRFVVDVHVVVGTIEAHGGGDYLTFDELRTSDVSGLWQTDSPVLLDSILRVETMDGTVHRF